MFELSKLYQATRRIGRLGPTFQYFIALLVVISATIAGLDLVGTALIAITLQNLDNMQNIPLLHGFSVTILQVVTFLMLRVFITFFFLYLQGKMVYRFMAEISQSIIARILFDKDSDRRVDNDKIMQLCVTEANNIGVGFVLPTITLFTEVLIVISMTLFAFLMVGPRFIALSLLIVFISVLYFSSIRPYLDRLGKRRLVVESDRITLINFITYSVRELFCYNVEEKFLSKYKSLSYESAYIGNMQQVLKNSQKYWLEATGIAALLALVWASPGLGLDELIILGLYGYKVVPSANRILGCISSISYYRSSVLLVNRNAEN